MLETNIIIESFLFVFLGFFTKITKILDGASALIFNKFVFNIILPITIFSGLSNYNHKTNELSFKFVFVFILCIIIIGFVIFLINLFLLKIRIFESFLLSLSSVIPNSMFIGFPIINQIFGDNVIFQISIYTIIINIIIIFSILAIDLIFVKKDLNSEKKGENPFLLFIKKPIVFSAFLGFILSYLNPTVPVFLTSFEKHVAALAGPVSLFTIGLSLTPKFKELVKFNIISSTILKLFIFPILSYFLIKIFRLKGTDAIILFIIFSLPTATIIQVLSQKYKVMDTEISSIITLSTIFYLFSFTFIMYFSKLI